jgi:hypothetical protein
MATAAVATRRTSAHLLHTAYGREGIALDTILLDTIAAAKWLDARGVRRTPATLRKLRCTGGGPRYRLLGQKPYYTPDDLATWIEERLSPPVRSTSEILVTLAEAARSRAAKTSTQ